MRAVLPACGRGPAPAPSPGRAPLLTPEQKAELKALVVAGPDPERDKVVRWRCVDLRAEVARRFGVEVREGTIGGWLHQLGLRRRQPRPHHPKRDAAAQEAYKKFLGRQSWLV
jgi:transposase